MKTLSRNEWIAVVVAVCVVGFFFVFGSTVISFFTHPNNSISSTTMPQQGTGLMVEDNVTGSGTVAEAGDKVTVNYVGSFTNGTVFDSSVARNQPFTFILGAGQVIPGWDQGLVGMKVGGTRTLIVPPTLAYGSQAYGPIPANSTLIFQVQLLDVEK